ncbi:MFS transporter [Pseudomonas prosekii]|uniref:MFS transporter n=1 Tax=Pseudomonas prosekii TaxID=1148509 RepID=UPI003F753039
MNLSTHELKTDSGGLSLLKTWSPVAAITFGTFTFVTTEFLPVGVLPEVASSFAISQGHAGLMMTLPGLLAAIGAPSVLLLAGNINRRSVLIFLCMLLVLSCAISAVATEFEWMLLGRALFGIGLGGFWSLALAISPQLVPERLVPKATAAIFAGVTTAMILGVPLGTYISGLWGWRASFVVTGMLGVLTLATQVLTLPTLPARSKMRVHELVGFLAAPVAKVSLISVVLVFVGHFSTYTYVAPLLVSAGLDTQTITLTLLGFGLVGFMTNIIASRFLPQRIHAALFVNLTSMALVLAALPIVAELPVLLLVALMVWGAAWGALPLCMSTFHRSVPSANEEASSTVFITVIQLAIAAGSGFGGSIVDRFGLSTVFFAGALLYAVAIIFLSTSMAFARRG